MLKSSERWKIVWRMCVFVSIGIMHSVFTIGLESDLMKSQGGRLIENSLQSSEYDIRLEDFFWTGSGDGPPSYRKSIIDKSNGRDTIITTSTVISTIYIDGNMDLETDPLCLHDCTEPNTYPSGYLPSDRQYWLLTVLAGYFSQEDYPIIEDKLAKLYRMAFSRQQSWHLGISQNILDNRTTIRKRSYNTRNISQYAHRLFDDQKVKENNDDRNVNKFMSRHRVHKRHALNTTIGEKETYVIVPSTRKRTIKNGNNRQISVVVHNITLLSNDGSRLIDDVNGDSGVIHNRNPSLGNQNQTEIIYSVFVDKKPVIAKTAADDMKLVTEDEVAEVMGKLVFIKAEPYFKEPQATPLVPASNNQNSNLIAVIGQNSTMLIIGLVMTVLLVVLLVGLLLMTRAKRKRSAEVKRLTVGRSLISPTRSANKLEEIQIVDSENGIENVAFENDTENIAAKKQNIQHRPSKNPVLHFPHPPLSSPSSSTSDSSIFYPKRRSRLDAQNVLDEKSTNHLNSKNSETPIYATVTKKKENRKKMKRKYLSENRVGSMDERQTNSSQSSTCSEVFEISEKDRNCYEREGARPLQQQYNKNKILQDSKFSVRSPDDELESPTEAFNKEILRALQRGRSPGDSISIGSYLSMASVRSFPKCTVPESLSRVLEPVSMTHLDHSEIEGSDTGGIPRIIDAHYKTGRHISTINMDGQGGFSRSQSDGADPGVLNWEMHKKIMEKKEVVSPLRDPVLTRTRFEGLLEGAIKLYSNEEAPYGNCHEENTINDVPGAIRPIENKSKSAMEMYRNRGVLSRSTSDIKNSRPFTAVPSKTSNENRTMPPSPYKKAWGSSTTNAQSPLVRPLSAGAFHQRPELPSVDVVRVLAPHSSTVLSTAPLIEAIQNELKKFTK